MAFCDLALNDPADHDMPPLTLVFQVSYNDAKCDDIPQMSDVVSYSARGQPLRAAESAFCAYFGRIKHVGAVAFCAAL
jgi:hypothetical protein